MDTVEFKKWLDENTSYINATKSNIISRLKRANAMVKVRYEDMYLFELSQNKDFQMLSISVKSQIRRAIKLYFQFMEQRKES